MYPIFEDGKLIGYEKGKINPHIFLPIVELNIHESKKQDEKANVVKER